MGKIRLNLSNRKGYRLPSACTSFNRMTHAPKSTCNQRGASFRFAHHGNSLNFFPFGEDTLMFLYGTSRVTSIGRVQSAKARTRTKHKAQKNRTFGPHLTATTRMHFAAIFVKQICVKHERFFIKEKIPNTIACLKWRHHTTILLPFISPAVCFLFSVR